MKYIIWNGEKNLESYELVFIYYDDYEIFLEEDISIKKSSKIIKINDREKHLIDSVLFHIRPDKKNNFITEDGKNFFNIWCQTISNFKKINPAYIKKLKDTQKETTKKLKLTKANKFLEILYETSAFLDTYFISGSFIGNIPLSQRSKDWWLHQPKINEKIETLINLTGHNSLVKVNKILTNIKSLTRKWKTNNLEVNLKIYGCYFISLSRYWNCNGNQNMSLLFSHRALDCFFASWGLKDRFLYGDRDGLQYKVRKDPQKPDYNYLLKTARKVINNRDYGRKTRHLNFIENINDARNLLSQTHGCYTITNDEAITAINGVVDIIITYEDDQSISKKNNLFSLQDSISEHSIFEHEDDFQLNWELLN